MNAGHFNNSHESSGDLNRGRRTESRVLFGYFLHDAKSDNPFSLQRTSRFSKPRFSAQNYNFPLTKLKPFQRKIRGSANLESAHTDKSFALTQLNPFAALVSLKHGRLAHVRSQFSLFRRSPTHKNLPLATFCTSERHFPGGKAAFLGLGGCRKRGIIADLFTKLCRNNPANRLTHAKCLGTNHRLGIRPKQILTPGKNTADGNHLGIE